MSRIIDTTRPFTRAEALAAGLTQRQLESGAYRRLLHGVYVVASVPVTLHTRAQAALLRAPEGTHISHATALALWGGGQHDPRIHLTVRPGIAMTGPRGVVVHRPGQRIEPVSMQGLPLAAPALAWCQTGRALGAIQSTVEGEALVRRGACTVEELRQAAEGWTGWGRRDVRRAGRLLRPGAESPPETRLRLTLDLSGLPRCTPQVGAAGRSRTYRIDLGYEAFRVGVEYEGRHHLENGQWQQDLLRREELESEGWRLLLFTHEDLRDRPADVVDRVGRALVERGWVPRRPWRLAPELLR